MPREMDPAERERMSKMMAMERDIQQTAEKIQQAESTDERAKLKERLKEQLGALFDLRESGREREVVDLEKRLAELKKILKERRERKAEIVERRIGQLMGKQEILEW
jgi:plasmid stabilization system protein ParE